MLEPKNTFVGLAGQKAWHICTGEALARISGKYLPSQLRTQKDGPDRSARPTGAGGGVGEEACLRRRRLLLPLLRAAEEEIEQAFGGDGIGGERDRSGDRNSAQR